MGKSLSKDVSFGLNAQNEHATFESRKIECFLENMVNDIQLWFHSDLENFTLF